MEIKKLELIEKWLGIQNVDTVKKEIERGGLEIDLKETTDALFELYELIVNALEREKVSLDAALKALEEGKEIESVASGFKYQKDGGFINVFEEDGNRVDIMTEANPWITTAEAKGKWYINA